MRGQGCWEAFLGGSWGSQGQGEVRGPKPHPAHGGDFSASPFKFFPWSPSLSLPQYVLEAKCSMTREGLSLVFRWLRSAPATRTFMCVSSHGGSQPALSPPCCLGVGTVLGTGFRLSDVGWRHLLGHCLPEP